MIIIIIIIMLRIVYVYTLPLFGRVRKSGSSVKKKKKTSLPTEFSDTVVRVIIIFIDKI